jgi:hypothetical protein
MEARSHPSVRTVYVSWTYPFSPPAHPVGMRGDQQCVYIVAVDCTARSCIQRLVRCVRDGRRAGDQRAAEDAVGLHIDVLVDGLVRIFERDID